MSSRVTPWIFKVATLYPKWTAPYQAQASTLRQFPLHLGIFLDTMGQLEGSKNYYFCTPGRRAVPLFSASPLCLRAKFKALVAVQQGNVIVQSKVREEYCYLNVEPRLGLYLLYPPALFIGSKKSDMVVQQGKHAGPPRLSRRPDTL